MSDFFLILIAVFILFSVFRRYIFYAVMGALTKKMFDQARQQQHYNYGRDRSAPAGSVRVEDKRKDRPNGSRAGEYVDFEEVKD